LCFTASTKTTVTLNAACVSLISVEFRLSWSCAVLLLTAVIFKKYSVTGFEDFSFAATEKLCHCNMKWILERRLMDVQLVLSRCYKADEGRRTAAVRLLKLDG